MFKLVKEDYTNLGWLAKTPGIIWEKYFTTPEKAKTFAEKDHETTPLHQLDWNKLGRKEIEWKNGSSGDLISHAYHLKEIVVEE